MVKFFSANSFPKASGSFSFSGRGSRRPYSHPYFATCGKGGRGGRGRGRAGTHKQNPSRKNPSKQQKKSLGPSPLHREIPGIAVGGLESKGSRRLGGGGLKRLPDTPLKTPPFSLLHMLTSCAEGSEKKRALEDQIQQLLDKGAVVRVPWGLGFYSRMFLAWKSSGSWRPILDLSVFNKYVKTSSFRMETVQSILLSIRQNDWMASIDLRDAYLQVPIHPSSQRYLSFYVAQGVFQFRALCFGLTTAPQVFTR